MPPVKLAGNSLPKVSKFKYLGHWVTEDLSDDLDIERERRALAVRCNMLSRRFARCTKKVKVTLLKSYCQSFYTCSLWTSYTRRAFNALRVQYNNGYRMLMGLPRYYSASGIFAEAHVNGFHAIVRNRIGSLMRRVRGGVRGIVNTVAVRQDSAILRHWVVAHLSPVALSRHI